METGTLYVVATPIGNLRDITLRALDVLGDVDEWVVEDTRRAGKLRDQLDLPSRPLNRYYDEVEETRTEPLARKLVNGRDLALLCDAGTPVVSDPGYRLINACWDRGIPVRPVPGVSAPITALSVSGFPSDEFLFLGFFPRTAKAKRDKLLEIKYYPGTVILFESPQRLEDTLRRIRSFLGDREVFLGREMTKKFEEYRRGPVSELIGDREESSARGEFTLLIAPGEREQVDEEQYLRELLRKGLQLKEAARIVARFSPRSKSQLYKVGLDLEEELDDPEERPGE